ncbi:tautomerase family protein [Amycolatopsis thermoflava]|uniref:4-oxalocrotonate tautomerase n=1 Tax=Amycolatopsis thermoflava TaxID=84480 RepID=A0A3N2H574_9PSEU|nr:tautomerase family protein [Amycolatopsis thermoflava]ROS44072.1 4-oxalocrotonate tautomerase [Amycolatopsis thermoflava]
MPHVRIDWFPGRTVEQKRELAEVLTREICRIGKCAPDSVGIVFTDVDTENWARAGKLFADG